MGSIARREGAVCRQFKWVGVGSSWEGVVVFREAYGEDLGGFYHLIISDVMGLSYDVRDRAEL